MEIILLSKSRGSMCRLPLGRSTFILAMLAVTLVGATLLRSGYDAATDRAARILIEDSDGSVTALWQRELKAQREIIVRTRAQAQQDLTALALRLGTLQAHVTRLDALGERLTAMAGLPAGEFDFSSQPALGGPAPADREQVSVTNLVGGLLQALDQLQDREEKLFALETLLMNSKLQDSIYPDLRPVPGGWISSGFGLRTDPVDGKREFHRGVDVTGRANSNVLAVASGVVTWAGRRPAYGNTVEINHGNGFVTRYSHNEANLVAAGDKVDKGQVIARMGATGRATGQHVHFEVERDGKIVNPVPYITAAAD